MNIKEKIEQTQTFKSLNSVQRTLTLQKTNVQHIEHGVNVAKNIGFTKWERICQFTDRNKNIVKQIIDCETIKITV